MLMMAPARTLPQYRVDIHDEHGRYVTHEDFESPCRDEAYDLAQVLIQERGGNYGYVTCLDTDELAWVGV